MTEGNGTVGVSAKSRNSKHPEIQIMVGAGFATVPAGGDQEQVKACPPTKGRLSRDLPQLEDQDGCSGDITK